MAISRRARRCRLDSRIPIRLFHMPVAPAPSAETLHLMRKTVAPMLAEVYPQFAQKVFGVALVPSS
jgi:hypothetical protein